jgi:hypothetical protein
MIHKCLHRNRCSYLGHAIHQLSDGPIRVTRGLTGPTDRPISKGIVPRSAPWSPLGWEWEGGPEKRGSQCIAKSRTEFAYCMNAKKAMLSPSLNHWKDYLDQWKVGAGTNLDSHTYFVLTPIYYMYPYMPIYYTCPDTLCREKLHLPCPAARKFILSTARGTKRRGFGSLGGYRWCRAASGILRPCARNVSFFRAWMEHLVVW